MSIQIQNFKIKLIWTLIFSVRVTLIFAILLLNNAKNHYSFIALISNDLLRFLFLPLTLEFTNDKLTDHFRFLILSFCFFVIHLKFVARVVFILLHKHFLVLQISFHNQMNLFTRYVQVKIIIHSLKNCNWLPSHRDFTSIFNFLLLTITLWF